MIKLPVSIGEAIDKITILDIKLDKIKDSRRQDVQLEYDSIYSETRDIITKIPTFYKMLKDINLSIWEMQDELRLGHAPVEYGILAEKIISDNDRRFRIKNKINMFCDSTLKEQKGYGLKKANIKIGIITDEIINNTTYLSTVYDTINICCSDDRIKEIFKDDKTVTFYEVEHFDIVL